MIGSEQGPALGSAIHAAVAAGRLPRHPRPRRPRWARVGRGVYRPIPANAAAYDELYAEYRTLHDYFGRGGNDVMHRLKARRRRRAAGQRRHRQEVDA